jgi:hypothetical protein
MHAGPYQFIDEEEGSGAYGWDNIMKKTTIQRMHNADTYSKLALPIN